MSTLTLLMSLWTSSPGETHRSARLDVADHDHAALVGPDADRALALGDVDFKPQLALVGYLAQLRVDPAVGSLGGGRDVLDADLEANRRPAVGEVLVGEHRGAPLHHRAHARRGEHADADRSADVRDQPVGDHELLPAFEPRLEAH